MLEVLTVLSVLNMGIASAALVLALRGAPPRPEVAPALPEKEPEEEKPFQLTDKRMQDGIANLLGYQAGVRRDES